MPRISKDVVIGAVIIIVGFVLVTSLSVFIEQRRASLPDDYADRDLELHGKRLKGLALGAEGLIADWYWIRSLQYVGNKVVKSEAEELNIEDLSKLNPRLLYPYLDNATDLDPKFFAAYSYGATVLPAIDHEQAIKLTEKGIANNPDQWRLYQYLGYIYWRLKRYDRAAEVYDSGSRIDGAPEFMRMMAAAMRSQGGSRETARIMYSQILSDAQDEGSRESARLRLLELRSLDERDVLNSALARFVKERGRCAASWPELLPTLRDHRAPQGGDLSIDASRNVVDPTGVPYLIEKESCKAIIDPASKIPAQ